VVQEVVLPVDLVEAVALEGEQGQEVELLAEQNLHRYRLLKQQPRMVLHSALNVKLKERNKSAFFAEVLLMMTTLSDQTSEINVKGKTVADFLWDQAEKKMCNLYATVDSARNDEVFKYFLTENVTYKSLFEGKMDIKYFGVSGFLVECKKDSILFNWLTTKAWGDSCSIFFISKIPFIDVLKHFQKLNRVYLEEDDIVYFRYYDPRVLRVYLPTCNNKEIKIFFGETEGFFVESENPEVLIEFQKHSTFWSDRIMIYNHLITQKTFL
jgi:hypothetical protein